MPHLRQLSSHACKHYMALILLRNGRGPGEPIPVTIPALIDLTGLHEGIIRSTRQELVTLGIMEVLGRGVIRLLSPLTPLASVGGTIGGAQTNAKSKSNTSSTHVSSLGKGGVGGTPLSAATTPTVPPAGTSHERAQALETLAWAFARLGQRATPGSQYGQTCMKMLLRRLREGYPVAECKRAVTLAATRRQQGDKFDMLGLLTWVWGKGLESLLSAPALPGGLTAGTTTDQREEMTATWAARSGVSR